MRSHRLTPEQAILRDYFAEVNRLAWPLRRATGESLKMALQFVPAAMREDVLDRVEFLHRKHGVKNEQ